MQNFLQMLTYTKGRGKNRAIVDWTSLFEHDANITYGKAMRSFILW